MAFRQFQLEELQLKIYKRKTSRSLRLSVTAQGEVRVSVPTWTPYSTGLNFAKERLPWIRSQLYAQPAIVLLDGQTIGKAHRIRFISKPSGSAVSTRIKQSAILVSYPSSLTTDDQRVQLASKNASIRALRLQAEQLLPTRLQELASQHGFSYCSVSIKRLKSRWGSCDQKGNIVLNLFLMQLPWQQIDYVLIHELTHTKVMQHGPSFWREMERILPDARLKRRAMRSYQPSLHANLAAAVA